MEKLWRSKSFANMYIKNSSWHIAEIPPPELCCTAPTYQPCVVIPLQKCGPHDPEYHSVQYAYTLFCLTQKQYMWMDLEKNYTTPRKCPMSTSQLSSYNAGNKCSTTPLSTCFHIKHWYELGLFKRNSKPEQLLQVFKNFIVLKFCNSVDF